MKGIKKLLSYVTKVEYAIMIVAFVTMVAAYFVAVSYTHLAQNG